MNSKFYVVFQIQIYQSMTIVKQLGHSVPTLFVVSSEGWRPASACTRIMQPYRETLSIGVEGRLLTSSGCLRLDIAWSREYLLEIILPLKKRNISISKLLYFIHKSIPRKNLIKRYFLYFMFAWYCLSGAVLCSSAADKHKGYLQSKKLRLYVYIVMIYLIS